MVSVHRRQEEIVSLLSPTGRVGVELLARHFDVTSETIRRDLRALEKLGLVQRVHGGAITPEVTQPSSRPQEVKGYPPTADMIALARSAVALIRPDTRSIFLDSGPTGVALATVLGEISEGGNWTVVTTSPLAGIVLARTDMPRIGMVGGRLSAQSQSLTGSRAVEMIGALRAEIAFIFPDGLVDGHSLTSLDPEAGATRRAMITSSSFTVLVYPEASLRQQRGVTFGHISEADVLVTDADINDPTLLFLSTSDLQVVIP